VPDRAPPEAARRAHKGDFMSGLISVDVPLYVPISAAPFYVVIAAFIVRLIIQVARFIADLIPG